MVKLVFTLLSKNSAVIDLRTGKAEKNLVRGVGWIKLVGKNKKIRHLLKRLCYKGIIPPLYFKNDKTVSRDVEITETEFKELIKLLMLWS
jgi:hypothetical protein